MLTTPSAMSVAVAFSSQPDGIGADTSLESGRGTVNHYAASFRQFIEALYNTNQPNAEVPSEEALDRDEGNLLHELLAIKKFKNYRHDQDNPAKAMQRDVKNEERRQSNQTEQIDWPEARERAFLRALVIIPPNGRSFWKYPPEFQHEYSSSKSRGTRRGRNELLADIVNRLCPQLRQVSRQHISSHIQVLKNYGSGNKEIVEKYFGSTVRTTASRKDGDGPPCHDSRLALSASYSDNDDYIPPHSSRRLHLTSDTVAYDAGAQFPPVLDFSTSDTGLFSPTIHHEESLPYTSMISSEEDPERFQPSARPALQAPLRSLLDSAWQSGPKACLSHQSFVGMSMPTGFNDLDLKIEDGHIIYKPLYIPPQNAPPSWREAGFNERVSK